MRVLVGDTGLVGTTLKENIDFDMTFNSSNFQDIKKCGAGAEVYLACLPATKWLVNKNLDQDIKNITAIAGVLREVKFSRINLISTIDVYCDSPEGSNEDFEPIFKKPSYGSNRYLFELMVRQQCQYYDIKIFRLPALYNKHIKKNIIYDMLNNHQVDKVNANSSFQWYDLDSLPYDMVDYSEMDGSVFNLFPEPIDTREVIKLFPRVQQCDWGPRVSYNFKTKHSPTGYIYGKDIAYALLKAFVDEASGN